MKSAMGWDFDSVVGSYDNLIPIEYDIENFSNELMLYESGAKFINVKGTCLVQSILNKILNRLNDTLNEILN